MSNLERLAIKKMEAVAVRQFIADYNIVVRACSAELIFNSSIFYHVRRDTPCRPPLDGIRLKYSFLQ